MVSSSNHDPFLDLFALDLLAVDLYVGDSFNAGALALARPVSGGAPAWWDDVWDFIGDIWSGAGDLAEKVGRSFSKLWDRIWGWVGGTVRWLYNWLGTGIGWIWDRLTNVADTVGDILHRIIHEIWPKLRGIGDTVYDTLHRIIYEIWPKLTDVWDWVSNKIPQAIGWIRDKVVDIWDMVTRGIPQAIGWIWDKVVAIWDSLSSLANWVATWLWPKLTDIWDMATRGIPQAIGWIWDKVVATWDFVRIDLWGHISGAAQGIGSAITDAFGDFVEMVKKGLDALRDALVDAIKWPWEHIGEGIADDIKTKIAIPMKLFRHQYTRLEDILNDALDPGPLALAGVFALAVLVMGFMAAFSSSWRSYVEPLFEPELQGQRSSVGAELLTVGVVQQALNRGFIDEATADHHLSYAGYGPNAKKAILELRRIIPSPTDLIRMAVREVFNPDLRRELTLDAEFPVPFGEWADKLGIDETWAANYWAAHWDLPSPSQGYEMLHRGIINEQQLADLLKALDYAPVWRDKLQAIAYSPITRVDLRRLYKGGIITEQNVFDGYKALGYNDERARWLTDWTIKYYGPDEQSELDDLTDQAVSTFRTAYRRHVITREEALDKIVDTGVTEDVADFLLAIDDAQLALNPLTDLGVSVRDLTVPIIRSAYAEKLWDRGRAQQELEALGYLAWEADLLLQLEDLAQQRELTDLAETVVKAQYVARAIDRTAATKQLDQLKVLPERRDLLLQRWDLQGAQKTRELTVAQLQRGLRDGLFPEVEVLSRFSGMGYNEADAKFLVDDVDKTPEGKARRLSVSQLSQAYKIGAITDAQLLNGLLGLGYSQDDAQVLVDIATPAPAAKARQLSAGQLSIGFRAGLVTEAELLEGLTALGYAQTDAELLRDIAAQKPEPAARKLSVAQLKELFKAETIDKAGLLAELLDLGYTDRDAGWIADLIAPQE